MIIIISLNITEMTGIRSEIEANISGSKKKMIVSDNIFFTFRSAFTFSQTTYFRLFQTQSIC